MLTLDIEDVKRLHLKLGDIVVLSVRDHMTNEAAAHVRNVAQEAFPDNKVVILAPGVTPAVVETCS